MSNKEKATKISWLTLAFMAFSTVWGFGNITNGFVYFNGPQVIFSWIFMFVLYFIPYALMVGELGSAFKNEGGGVSSWLHQTTNAKLAYYAGWTYWACHITYIASKGSGFLKALSWAVFLETVIDDVSAAVCSVPICPASIVRTGDLMILRGKVILTSWIQSLRSRRISCG